MDEQNPATPNPEPANQPAPDPIPAPQPAADLDISPARPAPVVAPSETPPAPQPTQSTPDPAPLAPPTQTSPAVSVEPPAHSSLARAAAEVRGDNPDQPKPLEVAPVTDASTEKFEEDAEKAGNLADSLKAGFWGFINWVVAPLLIVFILHNFVFQAYHVDGSSMVPTLHTSDYMIVSKVGNTLAHLAHHPYIPKRHQVVVFHYPKDPSLIFIKRVIALPGERVVVKNGTITVYNTQNPEGFTPDDGSFSRASAYTEGDVDETVPEGSVFVVGDNRTPSGSFDSREWGFLPSEQIIGDAVLRLLPLDGFRTFGNITALKAVNSAINTP